LWYGEPDAVSNAVGYAKSYSRSHDAVIRVYDEAGNAIETHKHAGDFKEWRGYLFRLVRRNGWRYKVCPTCDGFLLPPAWDASGADFNRT
jgi:hypothetical protein